MAEVQIFAGAGTFAKREMYEAALRSEGIRYLVKSGNTVAGGSFVVNSIGPLPAPAFGQQADFQLFVSSEDEARARDVIEGLKEMESETEADVPTLPETNPLFLTVLGLGLVIAGLVLLFGPLDGVMAGALIIVGAATVFIAHRI